MNTADDTIKAFIPDDVCVWLTVNIISEGPTGTYTVEITDEDFMPTSSNPRRRVVNLSKYLGLTALPLENDVVSETGVDDLTTLNYLHEASILHNLRKRFLSSLPYTYTGEICIAINPYKWLKIYTPELMESHQSHLRHELAPHVYATSAAAYHGLLNYDRNQSILVSGESGAGKTETVKILMAHIAHIAGKRRDSTTIEKVLQSNPLLESFGNAKTVRNDNSSRFGKFTMLQFDPFTMLIGSKCVTYLLEKCRVINQNEMERNYHIFHQVFAAPADVKESVFLDGLIADDFLYSNAGDTVTYMIEGESDAKRFLDTMKALQLLGVDADQQHSIVRIIAGILYLGQVSFEGDADESTVDSASTSVLDTCCELLGIPVSEFCARTTTRKIDAEGQELVIRLSRDQAFDSRDALAKDIYDKLFSWLVSVINASTACTETGTRQDRLISLLDIFGFESFKINRFEQLCINYANEKLQQKFTQDVFQAVQQEYKDEGLEWESIGYKDNADVLDLLEGRMGIIALLNEECLVPKGNDMNYLNKIVSACKLHPCFPASLNAGIGSAAPGAAMHYTNRDEFVVAHYAGRVAYCVNGFVDRNRDALPADMTSLMASSSNAVLKSSYNVAAVAVGQTSGSSNRDITTDRRSKLGTSSGRQPAVTRDAQGTNSKRQQTSFMKAETVTTKFKGQLERLMQEITATNVQYVRCIKPNGLKSSIQFDRDMVAQQLRCAGMIEAIRISRAAYPYRVTHADFLARFGNLRPKLKSKMRNSTPKEQCNLLLSDIWPNQRFLGDNVVAISSLSNKAYELGKTKVYFSNGVLETLEHIRGTLIHTHVTVIQKAYRGFRIRRWYRQLRSMAIRIQTTMRRIIYSCRYRKLRSGVVSLQRHSRAFLARRYYLALRMFSAASRIQSWARMIGPRRRFCRIRVPAVFIIAWWKTRCARKRYLKKIAVIREEKLYRNRVDQMRAQLDSERVQRERFEQETQERAEAEIRAQKEALEQQLRLAAEKSEMLVESQRVQLKLEADRLITEQKQRELAIVKDSSSKIEALQHELEDANRRAGDEIARISSMLAAAHEEIENLRVHGGKAEVVRIQGDLDAEKRKNAILATDLFSTQSKLTTTTEEVVRLSEVRANLSAENANLVKQLDSNKVLLQDQKISSDIEIKMRREEKQRVVDDLNTVHGELIFAGKLLSLDTDTRDSTRLSSSIRVAITHLLSEVDLQRTKAATQSANHERLLQDFESMKISHDSLLNEVSVLRNAEGLVAVERSMKDKRQGELFAELVELRAKLEVLGRENAELRQKVSSTSSAEIPPSTKHFSGKSVPLPVERSPNLQITAGVSGNKETGRVVPDVRNANPPQSVIGEADQVIKSLRDQYSAEKAALLSYLAEYSEEVDAANGKVFQLERTVDAIREQRARASLYLQKELKKTQCSSELLSFVSGNFDVATPEEMTMSVNLSYGRGDVLANQTRSRRQVIKSVPDIPDDESLISSVSNHRHQPLDSTRHLPDKSGKSSRTVQPVADDGRNTPKAQKKDTVGSRPNQVNQRSNNISPIPNPTLVRESTSLPTNHKKEIYKDPAKDELTATQRELQRGHTKKQETSFWNFF